MRHHVAALLMCLMLVLAGAAHADRCALYRTCDADGGYYGAQEETWRGSTDYRGNEVWTDNRGTMIRSQPDYRGGTRYWDNYGNSANCYDDYRGQTICRERPSRYGGLYE